MIANLKTFMKKNKKLLTATGLLVVLFASVASLALAANFALEGQEVLLGQSQQEVSVDFESSGALATKDLAVTLTLEDEVKYVDMTLPLGASETKATDLILVEEDSEIIILDVEPALNNFAFLGDTGGKLGDSQDSQNPDTSPNLVATEAKVQFDLPDPGTYLFKFYDAQNNYLGEASYPVAYNINDEALTIALDTGFHMNFDSDVRFTVNYKPSISGEKENLTLYMPPWFKLTGTPPSTSNYTVKTATAPLPIGYYAGAPNGQILVDSTNRPDRVNILIIEFPAHVTDALKFTFAIKFDKTTLITRQQLGRLMLEYGTIPDQIPLVVAGVGTSVDGLRVVDTEVLTYTTAYQNADGTPVVTANISHPSQNSVASISSSWNREYPKVYGSFQIYIRVSGNSEWYYPISDVVYYLPNPEVLTVLNKDTPGSGQISYKDKPYYKYIPPADIDINGAKDFGAKDGSTIYESQFKIPHSSLLPDTVYTFGDVFMDYTHMGVQYTGIKVGANLDLVATKASSVIATFVHYRVLSNNVWSEREIRREQGLREDSFMRVALENTTLYSLNTLIEKPIVSVEFPFESSPYELKFVERGVLSVKDMGVTGISYWLHEDPLTKRTLSFPAGDNAFLLPQSGTEHISKIEVQLNKIPPLGQADLFFSNEHSKYYEDGQLLPPEFPETIKVGVRSETGNAIVAPDSATPTEIPYVPISSSHPITLYRLVLGDTLKFGRRHGQLDEQLDLWGYNLEGKIAGHQKYYFKGSSDLLKDYENVEILFTPQTENDKKLLSLLDRIYLYNLSDPNYPSVVEAFYQTNLDDSWRPAKRQPTGLEFRFPLEPKEYLTKAKVNIDKLYGKTLPKTGDYYETDNYLGKGYSKIYVYNDLNVTTIQLFYTRNSRTYFTGSDDQVDIGIIPEKLTTEATVTIGDVAQHINPSPNPSATFNSNKTITSSVVQPYGNGSLDRKSDLSSDSNISIYQGDSGYLRYNNGATYNTDPSKYSGFPYDYNYTVYLEVLKGFDIISVLEGKIREVRPIEGSENKLYLIDCTGTASNVAGFYFEVYALPNTPVGQNIKVIPYAGVSHQAFKDEYMTPKDSYFNKVPYVKMTSKPRAFPANWKVTEVDADMQFATTTTSTVSVGEAFMDNIDLTGNVANRPQGKKPSFLQHEKEELMVEAYVGNVNDSNMGEFEATFTLPREGGTTTSMKYGGGLEELSNKYDLYLRDLPTSLNPLDELSFAYRDEAGQDVILSSPPLASELKKVKEIHVSFKNFKGKSMEVFFLPLHTDFVKTGSLIDPILGHVGASSRKRRDASDIWPVSSVAYALPVAYNSYTLDVGLGMDTTEVGTLTTRTNNVGRAKVYYEESGQDVLLHTTTMGTNSLLVNLDVSKVTVEEVNPAIVQLTKQNYTGNESNDSDFPEDTKTLIIDPADMVSGRIHLYDAAFVPIPELQLVNISLIQDKRSSQNYFYGWLWGNFHGTEGFYTYEILDMSEPAIGDITIDYATKKVNYLANQVGETTYTIEVTNRLGFKFRKENLKFTVSPNVPYLVSVPKLDFGTHKLTGDSATRALALASAVEVQDLSGLVRDWRVSAKSTPIVNGSDPSVTIPAETLQFVDKNGQESKLDINALIWEEKTLSTKKDYKKTFAAGASADSFLLKGLSPLLSSGNYTGTVTWSLELV